MSSLPLVNESEDKKEVDEGEEKPKKSKKSSKEGSKDDKPKEKSKESTVSDNNNETTAKEPVQKSASSSSGESKSPKTSKKKSEDNSKSKPKADDDESKSSQSPKSPDKKKKTTEDDGKTYKEGWLEKKGVNRHSWMRRYFVLKKNELQYFKDDRTPHPKGTISLVNVTLYARVDKKQVEMPEYFDIRTATRDYLIRASDVDEKKEWVKAIKDHITKDKSNKSPEVAKKGILKQHSFLGEVQE